MEIALFPGIQSTTMLTAILQGTRPAVKGIVLGALGQGDAPSSRAFLDTIAAANEEGITIVDSTQVIRGSVNLMAYQTGSGLRQAGGYQWL